MTSVDKITPLTYNEDCVSNVTGRLRKRKNVGERRVSEGGPAEDTTGTTTSPKDGVMDWTIPDKKILPDAGGLSLLSLLINGAAIALFVPRR